LNENGAGYPTSRLDKGRETMEFLLWLIAVVLVVAGIVAAVRGAVMYGVVLIIIGLLVGPGGVSIFT
jgi:sugar phosphate permease